MLSACSQLGETLEQQEGFVAKIEKEESAGHGNKGRYSMLVIPDLEDIDISKETEEELVRLAKENNGAYYVVRFWYKYNHENISNELRR